MDRLLCRKGIRLGASRRVGKTISQTFDLVEMNLTIRCSALDKLQLVRMVALLVELNAQQSDDNGSPYRIDIAVGQEIKKMIDIRASYVPVHHAT